MTTAAEARTIAEVTPPTRAQALLLEFLREHEAACPVCGYNVKALTRPICPECRQELVLTVGVRTIRPGWLFVALVPGFFSGIAACFMSIPTVGIYFEDGVLFPPFVGAVLFGWCSGLFAIVLAIKYMRFLTQSRRRQRWFAILVWTAHITAFLLFMMALAPHFN